MPGMQWVLNKLIRSYYPHAQDVPGTLEERGSENPASASRQEKNSKLDAEQGEGGRSNDEGRDQQGTSRPGRAWAWGQALG